MINVRNALDLASASSLKPEAGFVTLRLVVLERDSLEVPEHEMDAMWVG